MVHYACLRHQCLFTRKCQPFPFRESLVSKCLLLFLTLMSAVLCLFLNGEKHDKNVHIFLAQGGLMPYDIYFPILFLITSCRLCLHYTSLMTCCRCVVYYTFIFLHKSFEGILRVRKVCDLRPLRIPSSQVLR